MQENLQGLRASEDVSWVTAWWTEVMRGQGGSASLFQSMFEGSAATSATQPTQPATGTAKRKGATARKSTAGAGDAKATENKTKQQQQQQQQGKSGQGFGVGENPNIMVDETSYRVLGMPMTNV